MIRRFRRLELKYVLPLSTCERLIQGLARRLSPDPYNGDSGYRVDSLYFDSPSREFFWAKVEGQGHRRKVRLRLYRSAQAAGVQAMVEIKERKQRAVEKRRLVLPLEQALALCTSHSVPPGLDEADSAVANEVAALGRELRLEPAALTSYLRRAYEGREQTNKVRVTVDSDVRGRAERLELRSDAVSPLVLAPEWCILELKVDEAVPDWLLSLLADNGCSMRRVSKYCAVLAPTIDVKLLPLCIHPEAMGALMRPAPTATSTQ